MIDSHLLSGLIRPLSVIFVEIRVDFVKLKVDGDEMKNIA